jgi:hypothetical protein
MERVLDLTLKLADEGLSPAELDELEQLIESQPIARQRHLQMLEVEAALRAARHTPATGTALATAPAASLADERRVAAVLEAIRRPGLVRWWKQDRRVRVAAVVAGAGALAAVVALMLAGPGRAPSPGKAGPFARSQARSPAARHTLGPRAGRDGWAPALVPIQPAAPADAVSLDLGEGTTLEVRGRAVLGLERAAAPAGDDATHRVTVDEGTVAYQARRGAAVAATAITTPQGELVMRAGRAVVVVSAASTRVHVLEGQASVAPTGSGSANAVPAGRTAVLADGRTTVAPLPSALLVVGHDKLRVPPLYLDGALTRRLEGLGFSVETVDGSDLQAEQVHGRALMVISPTVSGRMHDRVRELSLYAAGVPILCARPTLYQDLGMTGPGKANAEYSNQKSMVVIIDRDHPLAHGLAGPVEVLEASMHLGWGTPAASAARVAVLRDNADHTAIFAYERDASMFPPAGKAAARRVGFFLHPSSARFLTKDAWRLFDAAVTWAAADAR